MQVLGAKPGLLQEMCAFFATEVSLQTHLGCIFNYCDLSHLYSTLMPPLFPSCQLATSSCSFLYNITGPLADLGLHCMRSTGFTCEKGIEMCETQNQPVDNSYINQNCEQRIPFSCPMIRKYQELQSELSLQVLPPCVLSLFLWEPQEVEFIRVSVQEAMFPMNHWVLERHLHKKPRLTHQNVRPLHNQNGVEMDSSQLIINERQYKHY